MSEVFRVSLDELVQGERPEDGKGEFQNPDIDSPKTGLSSRKILGIILLGIGIIVFMFWWIFLEGIYRDGMEIHAVIAWLMSLSLAVLIIVTSRLFFKKWKNRQIRGD